MYSDGVFIWGIPRQFERSSHSHFYLLERSACSTRQVLTICNENAFNQKVSHGTVAVPPTLT